MPTIEELQAEIAALKSKLGRSRDDDEPAEGKNVPYHRFQAKTEQLRQAQEALSALEARVAQTQKDYEVKVKQAQEDAGKSVTALQLRQEEDLALVEFGVRDQIGRENVRRHLASLPEAERPKSPAEWVKTRKAAVEAHLADPEKVKPPAELPWFTGYEQAWKPQDAGKAPATGKKPPNTSQGTGPRKGGISMEDLLTMTGPKDAALFGVDNPAAGK
jgi:hypothetical protein